MWGYIFFNRQVKKYSNYLEWSHFKSNELYNVNIKNIGKEGNCMKLLKTVLKAVLGICTPKPTVACLRCGRPTKVVTNWNKRFMTCTKCGARIFGR